MNHPTASSLQDHGLISARTSVATGTPGSTMAQVTVLPNTMPRQTTGPAIPHNAQGCDSLLSLFERKSFEQHHQPDSTILLHGDPAEAVYMVTSGTVRCCTIDDTGRRQIFSFATKGDYLGLSDLDQWHFTAEAVDHVILRSVPRAAFEQALAESIALRKDARRQVRALLERRELLLLTMASTKAPERLYRFLTIFAEMRGQSGYVALPMSRRDIADHLGMSLETVSRAFGSLKRKGLIDLLTHEKYKILKGNTAAPSVPALPSPTPEANLPAPQRPS